MHRWLPILTAFTLCACDEPKTTVRPDTSQPADALNGDTGNTDTTPLQDTPDTHACAVGSDHRSIQEALDDPSCDPITIPAGTYAEAALTIRRDVSLQGASSATTVLDGGVAADSILSIERSKTVFISGLSIQDGQGERGGGIFSLGNLTLANVRLLNNTAIGSAAAGGAIFSDGNLTLTDVEVRDNTVTGTSSGNAFGGGIASIGQLTLTRVIVQNNRIQATTADTVLGGGVSSAGELVVDASELRDNTLTHDGARALGGGLHAVGVLRVSGATRLSGNTITVTGTSGSGEGGGLFAQEVDATFEAGTLVTSNTITSENRSAGGGIALLGGSLTMLGGDISDNTIQGGDGRGGGLLVANFVSMPVTLELTDTRVIANVAEPSTDAIDSVALGGGIFARISRTNPNQPETAMGSLTLRSSTLSGNAAGGVQTGAVRAEGGGIYLQARDDGTTATLILVNTTLSTNLASAVTATGKATGGAVLLDIPSGGPTLRLELHNATLYENAAEATDALSTTRGGGLVFAVDASAATTAPQAFIRNSILSENAANLSSDCDTSAGGTLETGGYNIVGDTLGCTFSGDTSKDITGQPLALESLADNGGPTETHAVPEGNAAVDAGNPSGCLDENDVALVVDQRGNTRPARTACDIGAYELQ